MLGKKVGAVNEALAELAYSDGLLLGGGDGIGGSLGRLVSVGDIDGASADA